MKPRFYGWQIFLGSRSYKAALEWQKRMVKYRRLGTIRDILFYLEHPDVITVGRDCKDDLSGIGDMELFRITRGGGVTYHGPGQLVMYPIFDLGRRGKDLHRFIRDLEEGIIKAFNEYGLSCRRHDEHTGVWVRDKKIASIGVAIAQWISYHGVAVNLNTNLDKFKKIDPCGLKPEIMTTACEQLGKKIRLKTFAKKLTNAYSDIFETKFDTVELEELAEMVEAEESSQSL
jgi:lipoate-protein ligase B